MSRSDYGQAQMTRLQYSTVLGQSERASMPDTRRLKRYDNLSNTCETPKEANQSAVGWVQRLYSVLHHECLSSRALERPFLDPSSEQCVTGGSTTNRLQSAWKSSRTKYGTRDQARSRCCANVPPEKDLATSNVKQRQIRVSTQNLEAANKALSGYQKNHSQLSRIVKECY